MKPTLLVPFGLKDGKLYDPLPDQVSNGKACGCICPACKKPLVAKQNANTPHFAHEQDSNCSKGFETAVHLAVKQIIADRMEFRFPSFNFKNKYSGRIKIIQPQETVKLQSVRLEEWLGDIRPDIVVESNNTRYLIEVAVTHYINKDKLEKITVKKIPTIEIDVSGFKQDFTLKQLESAIFTEPNQVSSWKFHLQMEQLELEAWQEHQKLLAIQKQKEEAEKLRKQEEEQERLRKFEAYKNYSPEQKLHINLKAINLTENQMNEFTSFIPWESSFGVDRIVWQSAVLAFIAKAEQEQGWQKYMPCQVHSGACVSWLRKVFKIHPPVKDGEKIALQKYFRHLESLGILNYLTHGDFDILISMDKWSELMQKKIP